MAAYPRVPLREVCQPVERLESPTPGKVYRQIGVRLWGQGAYEREAIDGGKTRYATLSRVEADDIIVNKIWARNGSVAVVSPELSGCYGSGEFPTFAPDRDKLLPGWFHWITKTRDFWQQCDEKSQGTSGKTQGDGPSANSAAACLFLVGAVFFSQLILTNPNARFAPIRL